jgi:hypothetical protein
MVLPASRDLVRDKTGSLWSIISGAELHGTCSVVRLRRTSLSATLGALPIFAADTDVPSVFLSDVAVLLTPLKAKNLAIIFMAGAKVRRSLLPLVSTMLIVIVS